MSIYAVLLMAAVVVLGTISIPSVRDRLRVTPETYAKIALFVALGLLIAIATNLWANHESRQITEKFRGQIDALTTRAAGLKERVAVNKANTVATTQQAQDAIQRNDLSLLKDNSEKQASLSKERDQLAAEGTTLSNDLATLKAAQNSARQAQSQNEFWTALGTITSLAILFLGLGLNRSAQKAKTALRAAQMRQQGLGPLTLSAHVIELANNGKKIAAIAAYRAETGTDLIAAKGAVEAYLAQFAPDLP